MLTGKRLYCGNLPYSATADEVREVFAGEGRTVVDLHLVMDRETGRPRGFAFVEMSTEEEAAAVIQELDGRPFQGRPLTVKEARERPQRSGGPRPPRPGGGRYVAPRREPFPDPTVGLLQHVEPPRQQQEPKEYGAPEDIDYRDRSDRGRRGRDRRGGRRRGDDFDSSGW